MQNYKPLLQAPDQHLKPVKEIVTYVGRNYTRHMGDLIDAIQTLNLVDPVQPDALDPAILPAFEAWKYEFKEHQIELQEYNNSRAGLFTLVLGQCMDAMQG